MKIKLIGFIIFFIFISSLPIYGDTLELTEEELDFIEEHPIIRLGIDPHFVPFEFIDSDGLYKGIAYEYIKLIEEKTGLQLEVEYNLTWSEAYSKAVEKELDVLPCVAKTSEREKYFLFSDAYYNFERIILMSDDNNTIKSYTDIFGSTVAVQENSSHHSFLTDYPEISLNLYPTVEDALKALVNGSENYFIGNLAITSHLINEMGIQQLKYVIFESDQQNQLHFAVRNDWPELQNIIDKVLSEITSEEIITINNKWIGVNEAKDYTALIRLIAAIGSIILVAILVSFYWIMKLRKEINRRIETENDLNIAKQEAEVANIVKSNFLARMSHEIRTPLNAITGLSYLTLSTELTKTQRGHLEKIRHASDTMLSIINDILDFSKIEAGKIEIENESFELEEVIRNTLNIVTFKIEEKNLHFTLIKEPNLPNYYFGDSTRIGQVLLNLLNNAIKFTETGDIALHIGLYGFEQDVYQIEFKIKDTGIGMSDAHLENLFEPFNQEDASISRRFGGTGLGLSIVKNLLELMDGNITVESQPGKGTEFIIHLKLKVDLENERRIKKGFEYIQDIKTLVLNKNMNSLNLIVEYLKSFSIDAEFTSSEEQFINIIKSNEKKFLKPYDLVIVFSESTDQGAKKFIENIKQSQEQHIEHFPKVIYLLPFNDTNTIDNPDDNEYVLLEPFLPSTLYNAITSLFKFKVMASQVEVKHGLKETQRINLKGRVLVVEDNKTNQLIAIELLNTIGLTIETADHGQHAVELIKNNHYDLVLMDLHMPVLDGYEATKIIRRDSDIPIVAMTADAIEGVKEKCKSCGMNDFISKPFDPEKFLSKVSSYFTDVPSENVVENLDDISNEQLLNTALGIKCMGGNETLYRKIQQVFLEENEQTLPELKNYIDNSEFSKAADVAHKVKSSLGSIGSEPSRHTASELQEALLKSDKELSEILFIRFTTQFEQLIILIHDYLAQ